MKRVLFISSRKRFFALRRHAHPLWIVHPLEDPVLGLECEARDPFDFILFDPEVGGVNAPDLLARLSAAGNLPPVFALSRETCGAFRRLGSRCGVSRFFSYAGGIRSAVAAIHQYHESLCLAHPAESGSGYDPELTAILGNSPLMARLRRLVFSIRNSREPVLITGETGTGKDLVANLIHRNSPVASGSCVVQNVSCIAPGLAESELFGSTRGAFTDARDRAGLFEDADGGTLFLDEIGELPLDLQPKFLRVLEDGAVRRLGARETRRVSFRLICATNRPLADAVSSGSFRRDLFHRIDVIRLELPPLRAHPEDIAILARHRLLPSGKRLSTRALDKLCLHRWPGNVRELNACLARAASFSDSEIIQADQILF